MRRDAWWAQPLVVALGLGFSWLIGRSITRPLNGLARVMTRLADGDTTARIPATSARDEIGDPNLVALATPDFHGQAATVEKKCTQRASCSSRSGFERLHRA